MRVSSIILLLILPACSKTTPDDKLNTSADNPTPPAETVHPFKIIHTYVALCDNASQGIAPVPAKIGDGNDPANNLYWGCSDGALAYFSRSNAWQRLSVGKAADQPQILERLIFQHKTEPSILIIDAWQGSAIQPCIEQFIQSLAGQRYENIQIRDREDNAHQINVGGGADFLAFIGHNGLMEFRVEPLPANPKRKQKVQAAVLCCKSQRFFANHLAKAEASAAVMTATNMYPGAFILHDVIAGWHNDEKPENLRNRAAKAYAKNQKISVKSAKSVFAK